LTVANPIREAATGAWCDPALPGIWSGHAIAPAPTHLIRSAHHQIDAAANYCTDWAVQDALIAAARRGLRVRVVMSRSAYSAARWLQDHGVVVRWALQTPYLHAKTALVDGTTGIIGSANFSDDALAAPNHEWDVAIPAAVMSSATRWWNSLWARSQTTPYVVSGIPADPGRSGATLRAQEPELASVLH
jgi:phosphatidylserine/phosphatidylglycerophosphate/cardiolipin synthase-like enzyme